MTSAAAPARLWDPLAGRRPLCRLVPAFPPPAPHAPFCVILSAAQAVLRRTAGPGEHCARAAVRVVGVRVCASRVRAAWVLGLPVADAWAVVPSPEHAAWSCGRAPGPASPCCWEPRAASVAALGAAVCGGGRGLVALGQAVSQSGYQIKLLLHARPTAFSGFCLFPKGPPRFLLGRNRPARFRWFRRAADRLGVGVCFEMLTAVSPSLSLRTWLQKPEAGGGRVEDLLTAGSRRLLPVSSQHRFVCSFTVWGSFL